MRNPKDVFTSFFHFHTMASFLVKPGSQSDFLHKFLNGKGGYIHHIGLIKTQRLHAPLKCLFLLFLVVNGSWFDHVNSWLKADNKKHKLYICYEDMIMVQLTDLTRINDHTASESMQNRKLDCASLCRT